MSIGKSGVTVSYNIMRDGYGMQIYIDTGDKENNEVIFDKLYLYKNEIEQTIGMPLDWRRLNDKRASRIKLLVETPVDFNLEKPDTWEKLQYQMIEIMSRFEPTFREYIRDL